ncbi:guanylate kinase [Candidatus Hakubella thermalkaliphila]|uniref:Guanylate kinase n=1 Tax=Candidatus Hakubella thermalkaliphila TaxID=2754717 RepID=A0A6V8P1E3_9ACTN|nr:guanylate kinase [Candidatus Hakubella thermalkaliphila]
MAKKGNLIVVSGPSGAGKTTIINNFLKKRGGENFRFSVSATTRPKRAGEVDGRDYFFLTREEFLEKLKRGGVSGARGAPGQPLRDSERRSGGVSGKRG